MHGVARGESRDGLVQASNFFLLQGLDQVHVFIQLDRVRARIGKPRIEALGCIQTDAAAG